jgi:hypothetical protein
MAIFTNINTEDPIVAYSPSDTFSYDLQYVEICVAGLQP